MGYVAWKHGQETAYGQNSRDRLPLVVVGTESRFLARAWALGWAPPLLEDGLYLQNVEVRETGIGVWDGDAVYGPVKPPDPNDPAGNMTWDFDTTAETVKVQQALEQTHYPATAADCKKTVGVSEDGVEGADMLEAKFEWTENWNLPRIAINGFLYSRTLRRLTAKTNNAEFRGHETNCVLFLGASAKWSRKNPDWIDLTFKFRAGEPITKKYTLADGTETADITKLPFEYIWFRFNKTLDQTAKAVTHRPTAVYVAKMYDEADFSLLGIPTGVPSR